ncbi:MAG: transcriptional regulator, MarR family [Deltaproteobacteria bacterium]|nr:transcriptional regulator, MarR family [Deltaproteobacteria bacterium]
MTAERGQRMAGASQADIRNLARFRYAVRKFLRFSEEAARATGLTPQHHQLLLGVAGFTGKGRATIGELAEFLQIRHHSVVGLIDRAEALGLVRRESNPDDLREVYISLTADGTRKLRALAELHRKELYGMRRSFDLLYLEGSSAARKTGKSAVAPARKRG